MELFQLQPPRQDALKIPYGASAADPRNLVRPKMYHPTIARSVRTHDEHLVKRILGRQLHLGHRSAGVAGEPVEKRYKDQGRTRKRREKRRTQRTT